MKNIGDFLEKFKNLTNHNLIVREAAGEVLESELSIKLNKDQIRFKGGVLSVKISGPARAELFLSKESVIKKINLRLGKEAVSGII